MQRKLDVCLWDVKRFASEIINFCSGLSFKEYAAQDILRLAVEREFTLLGEALVRVRLSFPSDFDKIQNSLKVVRFRNRLVHMYDLMKDEEVWRVIQNELPIMVTQVEVMIEEAQR